MAAITINGALRTVGTNEARPVRPDGPFELRINAVTRACFGSDGRYGSQVRPLYQLSISLLA